VDALLGRAQVQAKARAGWARSLVQPLTAAGRVPTAAARWIRSDVRSGGCCLSRSPDALAMGPQGGRPGKINSASTAVWSNRDGFQPSPRGMTVRGCLVGCLVMVGCDAGGMLVGCWWDAGGCRRGPGVLEESWAGELWAMPWMVQHTVVHT
jgi:hypothetical protein